MFLRRTGNVLIDTNVILFTPRSLRLLFKFRRQDVQVIREILRREMEDKGYITGGRGGGGDYLSLIMIRLGG